MVTVAKWAFNNRVKSLSGKLFAVSLFLTFAPSLWAQKRNVNENVKCASIFRIKTSQVASPTKNFELNNRASQNGSNFDFSNKGGAVSAHFAHPQNDLKTARTNLTQKNSPQIEENVLMRDAYSQFPSSPAIPKSVVLRWGSVLDPGGYRAELDLDRVLGDASPLLASKSSLGSLNGVGRIDSRNNFNFLNQAPFQKNVVRLLVGAAKVSSDSEVVPETLPSTMRAIQPSSPLASQRPPARPQNSSLSPELNQALQRAKSDLEHLRRRESAAFKLKTYGPDRYFWYLPKGQQTPRAARVLDIHESFASEFAQERHGAPYSTLHVLVEWVGEGEGGSVGGAGSRLRHVEMLRSDELTGLTRNGEFSETMAAFEFFSSLSFQELQTLQLAKNLGLTTFGFAPRRRVPGVHDSMQSNPLEELNDPLHLAIKSSVLRDFGSIDDLLLPGEATKSRETLGYNILDVFSRLDPSFVLDRLHVRPSSDPNFSVSQAYEFNWVITEDGRLKISPHVRVGNNLKPLIYRLAHGRRVFAGGLFTVDGSGRLEVRLESFRYQIVEDRWQGRELRSFETDSQTQAQLVPFIQAVFFVQAGATVARVTSHRAERPISSYISGGVFEDFLSGNTNHEYAHFFEDFFNSFFSGGFKSNSNNSSGRQSPKATSEKVKWDPEDSSSAPLVYEAWLKKTGHWEQTANDTFTKLNWAYYVLGVDKNTPLADVKKSHRKLSMKFHSDRNKQRNDTDEVQKSLNEAWSIIESLASSPAGS